MCQFILCFFRQLAQTTYLYLNLSHIFPNKVNLSNTYTYYKRWFSVTFKIPFVVIFQTTSSTTLRVAILKIRHTTIILQLYRNYKNHQTGKSGTLCSKNVIKIVQ